MGSEVSAFSWMRKSEATVVAGSKPQRASSANTSSTHCPRCRRLGQLRAARSKNWRDRIRDPPAHKGQVQSRQGGRQRLGREASAPGASSITRVRDLLVLARGTPSAPRVGSRASRTSGDPVRSVDRALTRHVPPPLPRGSCLCHLRTGRMACREKCTERPERDGHALFA
jgi:hypothetical protein